MKIKRRKGISPKAKFLLNFLQQLTNLRDINEDYLKEKLWVNIETGKISRKPPARSPSGRVTKVKR